jgi:hypothetical protein
MLRAANLSSRIALEGNFYGGEGSPISDRASLGRAKKPCKKPGNTHLLAVFLTHSPPATTVPRLANPDQKSGCQSAKLRFF